MLQLIAFAVALAGSAVGAAWDLRTTEIPDEIPYAMIAIALALYGWQSYAEGSLLPLAYSVGVGGAFFAFGYAMYRIGQWGGGDAKLLAAVGCLMPFFVSGVPSELAAVGISIFQGVHTIFPFPLSYFFNVFFVGAAYMMVYAAYISARNRDVLSAFGRDVKATSRVFLAGAAFMFIGFASINFMLYRSFGMQFDAATFVSNSLLPVAATAGVFLVWRFARAVENVGFRHSVSVKQLRVGDVLESSKVWEGITEADIRKMKKSGRRSVRIKEGVRFAPAFPLALLFTLYAGDAIMMVMKFLG
jgi:Flp pilus assembly protein protease CpaA